ncbi:MAG: hypothetical protein K2L03_05890 [Bacteroidales bacterium]|nr:hypothetical protein [Bacteroidales bacterium]
MKKDRIDTMVIWGLVIILALIPFFRVGFTTGDDLEYYLTGLQGFRYWLTDADFYAKSQGRFFFYLKPLGNIPYLIDNFYFTRFVQYLSLLASYGFFAYFIFKVFKSRNLSLILLLMLIAWMQVTFNHHIPTISHPFVFSFSFILCISACLSFIRYTETARYGLVIRSAALFFIAALFYENYLLLLGFFGLYILIRNIRKHSFAGAFKSKQLYKEICPFMASGLLFVIIYYAFQLFYGTQYRGNAMPDHFSFSHFCQILWHCTTIVIPAMNFRMEQWTMAFNSPLLGGYTPGLIFALTHAPVYVYIFAVLSCLLFANYLKPDTAIPGRKIVNGIIVAVLLSFFVHTLIGIAEKYNSEYYSWMRGYITSYYALFGITLALALGLFGTVQWGRKHKRLYPVIYGGAIGLMFCTVVLTGYANDHISREWQRSQNRFAVLNELAKSDYFKNIPDGAILYGPDLQYSLNWGIHINRQPYIIGRYFNVISGKNYFYETTPDELYATAEAHPDAPVFCLNTGETVKACEIMLVFSNVGKAGDLQRKPVESWRAESADIFYYSPTKDYELFYTCDRDGTIIRDGCDTIGPVAGLNRLRCKQPVRRRNLTQVSLTSDGPIFRPDGFNISDMIK